MGGGFAEKVNAWNVPPWRRHFDDGIRRQLDFAEFDLPFLLPLFDLLVLFALFLWVFVGFVVVLVLELAANTGIDSANTINAANIRLSDFFITDFLRWGFDRRP